MPTIARRPCNHPGCGALVYGRYCTRHEQQHQRDAHFVDTERRGDATARGYDSRWRALRDDFLRANRLCVRCLVDGVGTPATVVDHIVPHRGDDTLRLNRDNLQPLCAKHHQHKTIREGPGYRVRKGGAT